MNSVQPGWRCRLRTLRRVVFSETVTVSPSAGNHNSDRRRRPVGATVPSVAKGASSRSRWLSGMSIIDGTLFCRYGDVPLHDARTAVFGPEAADRSGVEQEQRAGGRLEAESAGREDPQHVPVRDEDDLA